MTLEAFCSVVLLISAVAVAPAFGLVTGRIALAAWMIVLFSALGFLILLHAEV